MSDGLDSAAPDQVQDHRQVVDAERPERVLVLADDPEVLAVAVDAQHVAELAGVDEPLQLLDAGVVEQQVPGHQHEVPRLGELDELLPSPRRASPAASRRTRACRPRAPAWRARSASAPASRSRSRRAPGRCRDRRRTRHPRVRVAPRELLVHLGRRVGEPPEVGELVEVPDEVLAPVARGPPARRRRSQLPDLARCLDPLRGVAEVDDHVARARTTSA